MLLFPRDSLGDLPLCCAPLNDFNFGFMPAPLDRGVDLFWDVSVDMLPLTDFNVAYFCLAMWYSVTIVEFDFTSCGIFVSLNSKVAVATLLDPDIDLVLLGGSAPSWLTLLCLILNDVVRHFLSDLASWY